MVISYYQYGIYDDIKCLYFLYHDDLMMGFHGNTPQNVGISIRGKKNIDRL